MTHHTDELIKTIAFRYNPENDVIPGTPLVTCTDYDLLQIIEDLKARIERLEADMNDLTREG